MGNVGYKDQGRYEDAEALYVQSLAAKRRVLGVRTATEAFFGSDTGSDADSEGA